MNITYHKVAYVHCTHKQFEKILLDIQCWADGGENICVSLDSLMHDLEEGGLSKSLYKFLRSVVDQLEEGVVDIIFNK